MSRIYSSVSNYFRKHRRFIAITTALVGGTYLIGHYSKQKLLELQEKNNRDRTAKENLKRRFEQNLNDCTYVVMSLLPTLSDFLLTELDLESIIKQARQISSVEAGTPELSNSVSHDRHRHESEGSSGQSQDEGTGGSASVGSITSVEGSGVIVDDTSQIVGDSTVFVKSELENDESSNSSASSSPEPATQKPAQKTKQELWEEIKILSFSRTFTALYTLTLITLLTHIQINLLGRFTYLSSVAALNRNDQTITLEPVDGTSIIGSESRTRGILNSETEGKYLGFSWWILARGWRIVEKRVRRAVEHVLGPVSLRRTVTAAELEALIAEIRARIENQDESNEADNARIGNPWIEAMLPSDLDSEHEVLNNAYYSSTSSTSVNIEPELRELLNETKDFIDSEDFRTVLATMLDEVFQILSNKTITKPFENTTKNGQVPKIMELRDDDDDDEVRVHIIKFLSPVDKEIHIILNGRPNDYVEALSYIKELQCFSAIIYASFDEYLTNLNEMANYNILAEDLLQKKQRNWSI